MLIPMSIAFYYLDRVVLITYPMVLKLVELSR